MVLSGVFQSEEAAQRAIRTYYESRESRMGYELVFGGTQHFGYYTSGTWSPFPIDKSLRRMEEQLMGWLALPSESRILDAGCGVGHVSLYLAKHGMRVTGVDVMDHHVEKARQTMRRERLSRDQVAIEKMNFEHLEVIPDASHDGVFTMQSLGHAFSAEKAVSGFFRILKPGGRFALVEVERRPKAEDDEKNPKLKEQLSMINVGTGMPTNERSYEGFYAGLLEEAGFVDVETRDISPNILPVVRMFYIVLLVPYLIVRFLGIEKHFVSMLAGTAGYVGYDRWRFIVVTGTKPHPHSK